MSTKRPWTIPVSTAAARFAGEAPCRSSWPRARASPSTDGATKCQTSPAQRRRRLKMNDENEGAGHGCGHEPAPENDRLDGAINSTINPKTKSAQVLRYGTSRTPLARIVPDITHPNMWRIAWPDGRQSDMKMCTRAKDAAAAICERGPPARNRRLLHWKWDTSNSPPEAAGARQNEVATTDTWTDWPADEAAQ